MKCLSCGKADYMEEKAIEPDRWYPHFKVEELRNVCSMCGDYTVNHAELQRIERIRVLFLILPHLAEKEFHYVRKVLGVPLAEWEHAETINLEHPHSHSMHT